MAVTVYISLYFRLSEYFQFFGLVNILLRDTPPFEAAIAEVKATHRQEDQKAPNSLLDETAFLHLLVAKEGEPSYVPLSTNLGLKFKRRMLYFQMDFGELTLDGLIDTGAHSSAITEADFRKIRLLAPQSKVKEGPARLSKSWLQTET